MKHYEGKIKDLEVEIWQQRNLNKALEKMLRELIQKFKKQKNRIKNKLAETIDAKDGLEAYVAETENNLVDVVAKHVAEAEKHVKYKAKAQRHKRKKIIVIDKYAACKERLEELQADIVSLEVLLDSLTDANIQLYDDRERVYNYLQYCVVSWKYRFKQWWTGIYHIDKLRKKI